ncbi:Hypothetical_protein [Hexamita inflata]|uniref:Hypothetical_protein n=1 Tax=Hexamita inflata TaxID=28002 RepID=A0AA86Q683_9EUKA|nr:Hypothetical protein HINF_LOCUS40547 [Hexamita inflata]CAI9952906.1 Hypothetical protein HINF_LOCUS40551 [Hexamita inflata]
MHTNKGQQQHVLMLQLFQSNNDNARLQHSSLKLQDYMAKRIGIYATLRMTYLALSVNLLSRLTIKSFLGNNGMVIFLQQQKNCPLIKHYDQDHVHVGQL